MTAPHGSRASAPTPSSAGPASNGNPAPVGIFDSGLGGLSVLRAVRAQLPHETLLYVADSLHAPYGLRDNEFITERTLAIGEWLVAQGAKALVVACNTATAESIALARGQLSIPIIGVEPGIKPAASLSKSRIAGVLATQVTLRSERFRSLIERYAADCHFICQPGLGLVEAVERCEIDTPEVRALLASYIEPMLTAGADTLVLGCTHYPFLDALIRDIAGPRLTLVDTSVAIARQLERVLDAKGLRAPERTLPTPPKLYSTDDGTHMRRLAASLLGLDVPVEQVSIEARGAERDRSHA
ncbi:MAG TPA: glutamate racemase [Trinickia sp.]|jgi:glutamate racemase|nr:glutamate racemase [Trinickia sp.]